MGRSGQGEEDPGDGGAHQVGTGGSQHGTQAVAGDEVGAGRAEGTEAADQDPMEARLAKPHRAKLMITLDFSSSTCSPAAVTVLASFR